MEPINTLSVFLDINPFFIALVIVWTLVWKGLALWRAAGLRQKWWFITLLFINTLGLLEIIYLFLARQYKVEVIDER